MDSDELGEAEAFYLLEPWGCELEEGRWARMMCLFANANSKKPYEVSEFMLDHAKPFRSQVKALARRKVVGKVLAFISQQKGVK